jgi:hypothetical protein
MRPLTHRNVLSICLAVLGAATGWQPAALGAQQTQAPKPESEPELKIVILEGEEGVNIIKKKTAVRPVVEVRDKNNAPVAGAAVVFLLPQSGPGGTFATGGKMMTVVTDSSGRATSGVIQPSGTGQFKIQVTASHQGRSASSSIAQTNQLGAAAGMSGGMIAAIVAGAAGAAVGLAVKLSGGKNNTGSSAPNSPPVASATIGVGGGPVFTPPR